MNFGERLKEERKKIGISQKDFGRKIGVAESTISLYESNKRSPDKEILKKISLVLGVSVDYLLGEDTPYLTSKESKYVRIPVLGRIIAGLPMEAIQEPIDWEEIPRELATTGEFFALKVKGHSMEPRILEGDVVIVKKQPDVESGKIAVVLVNGNEATLKRVKKQKNGITLIANNVSEYDPHFYTNEEIEKLPVQILGEVVELRGKF